MKLFTNNKLWWVIILTISLIISLISGNNFYPEKSNIYNIATQTFGTIIFGFVILLLPYLTSIIIKKELKDKKLMISFSICFGIACIIMLL
jgi:ABC-type transport system involved in multi-copper enzyme maturation permease subunit